MSLLDCFATAPKGVEPLLAEELRALGVTTATPGRGGVAFRDTLAAVYRVCLWTRTASRVLARLTSFPAPDADALYEGARAVPWEEHLGADRTVAVDFVATGSRITHSLFGAQKIKDAIVDRLREREGRRPSVDRRQPDIRIHCYVLKDMATVSLDLAGDSLHRRGYREETVVAPLKENLAAALLLKAGWPALAAQGGALVDPLCGSGTLLIEAAWLAADTAPGIRRARWGFTAWRQHDPALWRDAMDEAEQRRERGLRALPPIVGYDRDAGAVRAALINAGRAGLGGRLRIERRDLAAVEAPPDATTGLVIANPPYGERLDDQPDLAALYRQLGDVLKTRFQGWQAAVFTGNPELGKTMGLRARRINAFHNGALACKLLGFAVIPEFFVKTPDAPIKSAAPLVPQTALGNGAVMFANRLRKNLRALGRWAEREGITCYRLYDADMPEYNVAVDWYEHWVHVQEYQAPATIDPAKASRHLEQIKAALPTVLAVPPERIFHKRRHQQKGAEQYQKQGDSGQFHEVREGPARFLVNFTDYLDTGLFLDHRLTRRMIGEWARERRFLNLFAYTASATVLAALGGAISTTSVDMSPTYLQWAARNLALNGIGGPAHRLVQTDCLSWLGEARERFDLIFLDPPTFSNSKRMAGTLDVQRDHVDLIHQTMRLLERDGVLIFSTNHQRFKLNQAALGDYHPMDISRRTLPEDFRRSPRIHQCWILSREPARLQTTPLVEQRETARRPIQTPP